MKHIKNGLLDPDMTDQTMRLHMGELTAEEMRVALAAIRWANVCLDKRTPEQLKQNEVEDDNSWQ